MGIVNDDVDVQMWSNFACAILLWESVEPPTWQLQSGGDMAINNWRFTDFITYISFFVLFFSPDFP